MSLMNASWFTKLNMFPYLIRNIHIYNNLPVGGIKLVHI